MSEHITIWEEDPEERAKKIKNHKQYVEDDISLDIGDNPQLEKNKKKSIPRTLARLLAYRLKCYRVPSTCCQSYQDNCNRWFSCKKPAGWAEACCDVRIRGKRQGKHQTQRCSQNVNGIIIRSNRSEDRKDKDIQNYKTATIQACNIKLIIVRQLPPGVPYPACAYPWYEITLGGCRQKWWPMYTKIISIPSTETLAFEKEAIRSATEAIMVDCQKPG